MMDLSFTELGVGDPKWTAFLNQVDHDVYHLPGYVAIEAMRLGGEPRAALVSWTNGGLLVPYVVRQVPGNTDHSDLCSPYGYPGYLLFGDPAGADRAASYLVGELSALGYSSFFIRLHPLLNPNRSVFAGHPVHMTGETLIVDLLEPPEVIQSNIRKSNRYQARRLRSAGYEIAFEPFEDVRDEFLRIYLDTMTRVAAKPEYYSFDSDYFDKLSAVLGRHLTVATVRLSGVAVSAKLYSESCGIVQNMFGGTLTDALWAQPSVLEAIEAIFYFKAKGSQFMHLGGGLGGKRDSLFRFKKGFTRTTRPFGTIRIVLRPTCYQQLVMHRAATLNVSVPELETQGFFPLYRAAGPLS